MRIKKFPKYTRIEVEWADIVSDSTWLDKNGLDKTEPIIVTTLGYFLKNKKRVLKIAHSVAQDGGSDCTVIPWGCIKDVWVYEKKEVE